MWSVLGIDQIEAMLAHWRSEPPVDALFASFVGFKAPPRDSANAGPSADERRRQAEELMSMFSGGVIR